MENSKAFRVLIVTTSFVLVSCATSSYHANKPNALGTDMEVSPDRVIAQCEFIDNYSGDYANPYGFMIYILDEEKTVITVSNGTVLEKEDCFKRLQAANDIIEKGRIAILEDGVMLSILVRCKAIPIFFQNMESFLKMDVT